MPPASPPVALPNPAPQEASATISDPEFGPLITELRAGLRVRLALTFLFLVVGGLFVLVGAAQEDGVLTAIAIATTLLPIVFVFYQQTGIRVRIYAGGVERSGRFGKRRLAWDQLQNYQLNIMDMGAVAMAGAAGGLGGIVGGLIAHSVVKKTSWNVRQRIVLFQTDGKKITIGDDLKGYQTAANSLIQRLTERFFPAAARAYNSGAPVAFGKRLSIQKGVGITVAGRFGGQNLLPFAELASVGLERAALAIRKKDQKQPWKNVEIRVVPNVHVFLRLAEIDKPRAQPDDVPLAWSV